MWAIYWRNDLAQAALANIHRLFPAKAEINEAVARRLLCAVEARVEDIVNHPAPAAEKLRAFIAAIEKANADRFLANRRLHDLVETAFNENWPVAQDHVETITRMLSEIISQGNDDGDFNVGDCELVASLVCSVCIRSWHPRLVVECFQDPGRRSTRLSNFALLRLLKASLRSR
jgi:AcrR family transcriptional regulator